MMAMTTSNSTRVKALGVRMVDDFTMGFGSLESSSLSLVRSALLKVSDGVAIVTVGEAFVGREVDVVGDDAYGAVGKGDLDGVGMSRGERRVAVDVAHIAGGALRVGGVANG